MRLFIAASIVLSLIGLAQALPTTSTCLETHKVNVGETCKSIEAKYNISDSDLKDWTKKLDVKFDCDKIYAGETICVKYGTIKEKRDLKADRKHHHTTTTTTFAHKSTHDKRDNKKDDEAENKKHHSPSPSPTPKHKKAHGKRDGLEKEDQQANEHHSAKKPEEARHA